MNNFVTLHENRNTNSKMKKILIVLMALMPLTMWAQANTWEKPEVEETKANKDVNKDAKYLKGAVPEVDGKVVFSTTINAPGKSADQVFDIVKAYLEKMTGEKNQVSARIVIDDKEKHELGATFNEWLVFKSTSIMLDQTRMLYAIKAHCSEGKAYIEMSNIRYVYEENRNPQNYSAEEWISDKEALNKKGTRILPVSGKFRRKTIDRKDFLFNKFESLLK
jgi:colicin import membrane protein